MTSRRQPRQMFLTIVPFVCALVTCTAAAAQPIKLDTFDRISGWRAIHSHGDACAIALSRGTGQRGGALLMDFSFIGHMGSVSAQKKFALNLPEDFQLVFDIRGEGPVNNFVIRIYDSLDNVWTINRSDFSFPHAWTRMRIKKWQLPYGWGPSGGGDLRVIDRIEFMIDVVEGGSGRVWIDNLAVEPITDSGAAAGPIVVRVSSSVPGGTPVPSTDGKRVTGWRSGSGERDEWLTIDFGRPRDIGGVVLEWDVNDYANAFDVEALGKRGERLQRTSVRNVEGGRSILPLAASGVCRLRVVTHQSSRHQGIGIRTVTVKDPDFAFSPNEMFRAIAGESPRGMFPKYLGNQQSYWTIVGVPEDRSEAMMNEEGMIEVDRRGFSLEPFLELNGTFVTWADVGITQSLEENRLPIPSVHWHIGNRGGLDITALAVGPAGRSVLLARYVFTNGNPSRLTGSLAVAVRPFQVNPPWQTFTIVGGVSHCGHIRCGETIRVDDKEIIPLVHPDAAGACTFDQGDVTEYLRRGGMPGESDVNDPRGYASAALRWAMDLAPGDSVVIVLAVPFHDADGGVRSIVGGPAASAAFDRLREEMASLWRRTLGVVAISFPPAAGEIANSVQSTLGYILINADSVALQPGSRSYERSWIRDGAMMATALLQMGIREPVRKYLEWYGTYQYPDGKIPCVVDDRGAEPIPEHDSHGEFLYALMQYFLFTHDTTWLRAQWPRVEKTVQYIHALRATRTTELYRNGTMVERACYGLLPESISHEGYCPQPMHSYWDDFFVLRGLKDAARMAEALGARELARAYAAERDEFRRDLYASMRLVAATKGVNYIPGCVEQGEFGGLSATVGITPGDELGWIPDTLVHATFDRCYHEFEERKAGSIRWDSYLPYEFRFVGTFVLLGQRERAGAMLEWYMHDRRPRAWNGWGEVVWRDTAAPRCIGDMPHAWAGSDFIRSFRSMLVYERERDTSLVVGGGIQESWLTGPEGLAVKNLPTHYGTLTFHMIRTAEGVDAELSGALTIPPGGLVLTSPLAASVRLVRSDGPCRVQGNEIRVSRLPMRLSIDY